MNWLNELIKNKPVAALLLPTGLGGLNFLGNLLIALSDGDLDGAEIHNLMSSASGVEMLLLIIIILVMKKSKTDDKNK